jgi:hypothetical protein
VLCRNHVLHKRPKTMLCGGSTCVVSFDISSYPGCLYMIGRQSNVSCASSEQDADPERYKPRAPWSCLWRNHYRCYFGSLNSVSKCVLKRHLEYSVPLTDSYKTPERTVDARVGRSAKRRTIVGLPRLSQIISLLSRLAFMVWHCAGVSMRSKALILFFTYRQPTRPPAGPCMCVYVCEIKMYRSKYNW